MRYQYQSLGSRDEIRILVLQPAKNLEDELHAKIVHRNYPIVEEDASGVNYWNATSYTWGLDPPGKILYIDSTFPQDPNSGLTTIMLTPNADKMLRHLRHDQMEHNLWVDAICLDQGNIPEKNQQIQRMDWIYRLALQVLIWLGDDDGTARMGMKTAEALAIFAARPDFSNDSATASGIGLAIKEVLDNQRPHAIDRLFRRPWFGRRWILQEVALAREAVVCCGNYRLPWDKFRIAMEVLSNTQNSRLLFQTQIIDDQSALALRTLLKVNRVSGNFLDLLWDFDRSACKEKNDVIYALSGLVTVNLPATQDKEVGSSIVFSIRSDADLERLSALASSTTANQEPFAIYPDYGTPWHLVFTQVAAHYVSEIAFAAITRHLYAFGSLHDTQSDWPSWVPDWSRPRRTEPKKGMTNVVPWARPVEVVDNTLHIFPRRLCAAYSVAASFPEKHQDFRDTIIQLLRETDSTPVIVETAEIDVEIRNLTMSEAIVGDLIRSALDVGICTPIPAESHIITEAWIINDLSAHAIARTIFTPEWRNTNLDGILDGIVTCLQSASLFVTDTLQLGIGLSKMKEGDHVVLIEDYHGLPDLEHHSIVKTKLQAAAILRLVEDRQQDQSQLEEGARYVLIGPCILARSESDHMPGGVRIKLV